MALAYDAILFDLFGTLVDDTGAAQPGSSQVLAALPRGRWAIVTSCSGSFARALLAHARLPDPQVLVAADDVAANKPAPDGYLLAAQRIGVDPQRCLVVEDSAHGIDAAAAAGMDVAAILCGRSATFARRATFTVPTLRDLRLRASAEQIEFELERER